MAHLNSLLVEQQLLVCILETRDPTIRALILKDTDLDDYATDVGSMVRKRIDFLLANGKPLGSAADMAEDPALSDSNKAVKFLRATPSKRKAAGQFNKDKIVNLIQTLKRYSIIRLIYGMTKSVSEQMKGNVDDDDVEEVVQLTTKTLTDLLHRSEKTSREFSFGKGQTKEDAQAWRDDVLKFDERNYISTGLEALNQHMHGFERGNLVTVSAPRGGGKTLLGMNMSLNQYLEDNRNVCFVSMEMEKIELWRRMISNMGKLEHDVVRYPKDLTEEQKETIDKAARRFHKHGIKNNVVYRMERPTGRKFTPAKLETMIKPYGFDAVYIDYITLFDNMGKDQWVAQMEYSRYLKNMASRLGCVVIVLSQLSEDERVKYGKSVEENTDYWIWWRWREDEEQEHGNVELRLAKARHAKAHKFSARFEPRIMSVMTETLVERQIKEAKSGKQSVTPDASLWRADA